MEITIVPTIIKTSEAAKIIGVSIYTLKNLIRSGKLTGYGFGSSGRKSFVTIESINRLKEEMTGETV